MPASSPAGMGIGTNVHAANRRFNGAPLDLQCGNIESTALAVRPARLTASSPDRTNDTARGVMLALNVTRIATQYPPSAISTQATRGPLPPTFRVPVVHGDARSYT